MLQHIVGKDQIEAGIRIGDGLADANPPLVQVGLLKERRALSPTMAIRLSRLFGNSPEHGGEGPPPFN
jgi:hypothetical protein